MRMRARQGVRVKEGGAGVGLPLRIGARLLCTLGLTALVGRAGPALAQAGEPFSTLRHWVDTQPLAAGFHFVPSGGQGGQLYACRFGGYETIVRVFLVEDRIVKEQVEVELPADRQDAVALGIISRFFYEFYGGRVPLKVLWDEVNNMRTSLARTGLREVSGNYLGFELGLRLDTSPDNSYMSVEQQTWGTLFWRGDASLPRSEWPAARVPGVRPARTVRAHPQRRGQKTSDRMTRIHGTMGE